MWKNKLKKQWLLIVIVMIAFVVRFWQLGSIPQALNRDEAALGYNAYALLTQGVDEWGKSWPLVFRSFGDYKLAGYVYSLLPSISLFGLNEFAVRLPSALAGIGTVIISFYLCKKLFGENIAYITSFFLAVSPWAVFYSRTGFEANLALFLFLSALYALFSKNIVISHGSSALLFGLSLLTYNAPLLIFPFLLFWMFIYKKVRFSQILIIGFVCALAFFAILPATKGKTSISIFSDQTVDQQRRDMRVKNGATMITRILTNPVVFYPLYIAKMTLHEFSPKFLVISGGRNPWHQVPNTGHLYWTQYVLFFIGLCVLAKKDLKKALFFIGILCFSIIPSIITVDSPHATRSLFAFVLISLISAIGLESLEKKKAVFSGILGVVCIEWFLYLSTYFRFFPTKTFPVWNTGISEALTIADQQKKPNEKIYVLGDPTYEYIFPLFYQKISPQTFFQTVERYPKNTLGFEPVKSFGEYVFADTIESVQKPAIVVTKTQQSYEIQEIQ